MSANNKFLNITTGNEFSYADLNILLSNNSNISGVPNTLVLRDSTGSVNANTLRCNKNVVNANSVNFVRENIGAVSNGSTYVLPSGRWSGELTFNYANISGTGMRQYAFYKAPGAIGNGWFNEMFHYVNVSGIASSLVAFNNNSGIFTFTLSGTNVVANSYIDYMSAI